VEQTAPKTVTTKPFLLIDYRNVAELAPSRLPCG
jgi:hypothetical protein